MTIRLEHLPADTLGLSPFARAALASGAVGGLPVVRGTNEIPRPADQGDAGERHALVDAIRPQLAALEAPPRVQTSLNVLRAEGSFAVVTGQQPGFLTAPLYSLYKALQACRLAGELSGAWGVPVVPIFWNHADDHDVAEVHHSYLLNRNYELQKFVLAGLSSGRQPISRLILGEDVHRLGAAREAIRQLYGDFPFIDEALELLFPRPGETLARTLTRAFTALLGSHGLIVVEPDWIRIPLSRALADIVDARVAEALDEGSRPFDPPAIDPRTAALVYRVDESGRRPLRTGGEGFRYDDEAGSRTPAELAAEIVDDPHGFSPGALLRPLAQDAVFPTCAYVGGYGELAYHGQLTPARDLARLPRTPFVPRISCTLVEPELEGALRKSGADLRTVLTAGGEFEPVAAGSEQPAVIAKIRAATEAARAAILEHRAELAELDPALGVNLKRAAGQIDNTVGKVLQKAERVHANKSGKGARSGRRLNNTLVPRGLPQERVLGPLAFIARHGPGLVDELYEELPAVASEHLVARIAAQNEKTA